MKKATTGFNNSTITVVIKTCKRIPEKVLRVEEHTD